MAYTADINIVVKGQAAVNTLQKSLTELGKNIDGLVKRRVGPSPALETFNKQLAEAKSRLNEVVAGTSQETQAIKNYVTALGNANAATERQNRLIEQEINLRQSATNQLEKLNQRKAEFTARTDEGARSAARQTAEFLRQQRIVKELAKITANAPAPQLLLAPAAPGAPAMGGGARSRITGPVERLGGARTQDQADMALRFAQALKQQVRPLSQIKAIYAGIASEAAAMQRIKALPDTAMLNAAARGIKSLETSQDRYNRELAESAERLRRVDRLEASRARRAEKLRQRAVYESRPPGGVGKGSKGGMLSSRRAESLMLGVGFPLLFGGGAGEVAGGLLGSFGPGMGFGGQILGSAIGGILDDFISSAGALGAALNPATADLDRLVDALGGASTVTGQYIKKLEALERSEEALAVATAELENLVGKQGVEALRQFGDDSTRLREVFGQAMTQMQAGVANLINSTGILQALTAGIESGVLLQQALQSQDPRQRELVQQRREASGPAFLGADPDKYFAAEQQLIANQRIINAEKQKQYEASLKLLDAEEKQVEITKQTTKLAKELKSSYDEILKSAEDRIQKEQAAVDRGLALSKARYEAELALNQLEQTRLERAYKYAQSQRERLDIVIAMFNTEVETAKLEYQQQLESIAAEERKLEIQLEQYRLAQETILLRADEARLAAELEPDAELRAASFKRIDETTARYLDKTREIIVEVEKQLAVQREIGEVQRQTAKTQSENKILAAQTRLEQKLVSEEIGFSENQALRLSNALAAAKQEAIFTAERGQQIVGVIEVGTQKTYLMAEAMSDVAAQAANAAGQIRAAVSAQNTLNAAKSGEGKSGGTVTRAAKGAYMSGGFQAFAEGGMVNRPTLGLIGEGGESEYVVPASKAKGFSMRYLSGARGSAAIPTAGDGGFGGSGPVNINIRTGPVMRQNGQNYVSVGDLEQALQSFADTMLRNNRTPGGRRYAGIG